MQLEQHLEIQSLKWTYKNNTITKNLWPSHLDQEVDIDGFLS